MKRYFEQLKPQERRWLAGVAFIVFIILNYFFIWPHFHDWSRDNIRMEKARRTNDIYTAELRHKDEYTRRLRELESDGSSVLPEDQAIDFIRFWNTRANNNKVTTINQGPLVTRTNEFFLEQQMGITVQADETNLVNFLYSLGAGNSMMRVRSMSLHPDPSHMQLSAAITLVASYQKKAPVRSTTPGKPAAVETKPLAAAPAPPPHSPSPVAQPPAVTNGQGGHTNRLSRAFSRLLSGTNKPGPTTPNRP